MRIDDYLAVLDELPLECDGLSRVVSTLLQRDEIQHCVHVGSVDVEGVGTIPLHWWIELPDGRLLDLRSRMWLGQDDRVPHGMFIPQNHQTFHSKAEVQLASVRLSPVLFCILANRPIDSFPSMHFLSNEVC